jgi:phosphate transport system substrate-binding protein
MFHARWRAILGLQLILVFSLYSCGGPVNEGDRTGSQIRGTITVSGAWALYPMMVFWGEEFQKQHPEVRFDISAGGAGKGMADVLAGAVDIGMVSREIYSEEIERGAYGIPVTKDAVLLSIHEDNPVWETLLQKGIPRETIIGVYITGDITSWGQVIDNPQITDSIHVFTRSDAAGAPATFALYLGGTQEDLLGIGVYGDPGLLEAVINDPLGIGYNNLNYIFDPDTGNPVAGARVVPIDVNGNGKADPTEVYMTKDQAVGAVAAGDYPSPPARDLYFVTKGEPDGVVKAFIVWVLTDGQEFVDDVGYIPLSGTYLNETLGLLNASTDEP